jgi:hypothetical protein
MTSTTDEAAKDAAQGRRCSCLGPRKVTRGVVAGQRDVGGAVAKAATGDVRKAVKDSRPGNTGEKNSADKEDTE